MRDRRLFPLPCASVRCEITASSAGAGHRLSVREVVDDRYPVEDPAAVYEPLSTDELVDVLCAVLDGLVLRGPASES